MSETKPRRPSKLKRLETREKTLMDAMRRIAEMGPTERGGNARRLSRAVVTFLDSIPR